MSAPTVPTNQTAIVKSQPETRLDALAAEYAQLKPLADATNARLKEITDGIKAELAVAAPGKTSVDFVSPMLDRPLRMTAKTSWRLDSKRLKAEDPGTYVKYAVQSTSWELRQTGGAR
jgi:hypothetical protein